MGNGRTLGEILKEDDDKKTEALLNVPAEEVPRHVLLEDQMHLNRALEALEDGISAADEISDINEIISGQKEEGIGENAARLAEISVENICHRLGIVPGRTMIGIEQFSSEHTRPIATRVSLEGLGDFLRKIWENVVKMTKYILDKLKHYISELLNQPLKVAKRVERVNSIDPIVLGLIENKDLVKAFGGIESRPNANTVMKLCENISIGHHAIQDISSSFTKLISLVDGAANSFIEEAISVVKDGTEVTDKLDVSYAIHSYIAQTTDNSIMAYFPKTPDVIPDLSEVVKNVTDAREAGPYCYGESIVFYTTQDILHFQEISTEPVDVDDHVTMSYPSVSDANDVVDRYNSNITTSLALRKDMMAATASYDKLKKISEEVFKSVTANADSFSANPTVNMYLREFAKNVQYISQFNNGVAAYYSKLFNSSRKIGEYIDVTHKFYEQYQ